MWKMRKLTLTGRIQVVKSQGIPQLLYPASVIEPPADVVKAVTECVYSFIWGKKEGIKRDILERDVDKGGMRFFTPQTLVDLQAVEWIKRERESDHPWTDYHMVEAKRNSKRHILAVPQSKELKELTKKWLPANKHIVQAMWNIGGKYQTCKPIEEETYADNRVLLTGNGKPLKVPRLEKLGLTMVKDLISPDGGLILPNQATEMGIPRNAVLEWAAATQLIRRHSQVARTQKNNVPILCRANEEWRGSVCIGEKTLSMKDLSMEKLKDAIAGRSVGEEPQTWKKAEAYLPNWAKPVESWSDGRTLLRDTASRDFYYRWKAGILITNKKLYKMKLKDSPNCTFCGEEETDKHLLLDCLQTNLAWMEVEEEMGNWPGITEALEQALEIKWHQYVYERKRSTNEPVKEDFCNYIKEYAQIMREIKARKNLQSTALDEWNLVVEALGETITYD
jgi:hypothetical protein